MESRIGYTAEYSVCGLDEGQATCLLSAVSGGGLSLVEPVDAAEPDPSVASGLADAMNRAYHAWIRTQPQLILELWPRDDDGLDETQPTALRLVEPVPLPPQAARGGLAQTHTEAGASLFGESRARLRKGV